MWFVFHPLVRCDIKCLVTSSFRSLLNKPFVIQVNRIIILAVVDKTEIIEIANCFGFRSIFLGRYTELKQYSRPSPNAVFGTQKKPH